MELWVMMMVIWNYGGVKSCSGSSGIRSWRCESLIYGLMIHMIATIAIAIAIAVVTVVTVVMICDHCRLLLLLCLLWWHDHTCRSGSRSRRSVDWRRMVVRVKMKSLRLRLL